MGSTDERMDESTYILSGKSCAKYTQFSEFQYLQNQICTGIIVHHIFKQTNGISRFSV